MSLGRIRFKAVWKFLMYPALPLSGFSAYAADMPEFNMRYGVTPVSRDIYDLHMTIFWICVIIGVLVFSVLIYALIMHRRSRGVKPATFHEHQTIEIIWAIVPLVILVIMAIPATMVLMRMDNTNDSSITIKITGYQWKWQYSYLDQGIEYFSNLSTPLDEIHNKVNKNKWYLLQVDRPMVIPTNEKIRFLLTSNDVIHSWWVPELGVKKDALPGFIHEAWAMVQKTGIYRGQCAELCGINHGYMPIVVEAVTKDAFNQWVQKERAAEQKQAIQQLSVLPDLPPLVKADSADIGMPAAEDITPVTPGINNPVNKLYSADELMEAGQKNYNTYCSACHQADGGGIPDVYPALQADSVAVGGSITRHIDMILNGIPGTAMQAFGPQLTDFDIASIVTYERNAWGNRTGDVIQPQAVAKQRDIFYQQKQSVIQDQAAKALEAIQPRITVPAAK